MLRRLRAYFTTYRVHRVDHMRATIHIYDWRSVVTIPLTAERVGYLRKGDRVRLRNVE